MNAPSYNNNYTLDILQGEAVAATKPLWEAVFTQDSPSFVDYYYKEQAPKNVTFVYRKAIGAARETSDGAGTETDTTGTSCDSGEIVAMLHLSPRKMCMPHGAHTASTTCTPTTNISSNHMNHDVHRRTSNSITNTTDHIDYTSSSTTIVNTYYIVGVATAPAHRRQGLMAGLMAAALDYAKATGAPFVYLMPAKEALYTPFGFQRVYEKKKYAYTDADLDKLLAYANSCDDFTRNTRISNTPPHILCKYMVASEERSNSNLSHPTDDIPRVTVSSVNPPLINQLSNFATACCSAQYDYYLHRTPAYYDTLMKELAAENGGILCLYQGETLVGYFTVAREDGNIFIQEMLLSEEMTPLRDVQDSLGNQDALGNQDVPNSQDASDSCDTQNNHDVPAAPTSTDIFSLPQPTHIHEHFIMVKNLTEIDYASLLASSKGLLNELV